jgi:hypothetical protein
VPVIDSELAKYGVAIARSIPRIDSTELRDIDASSFGSGTCVRVGGRYFIATAGHVINEAAPNEHFVATPTMRNRALEIVSGNHRGGRQGDDLDIGWLELGGRAAAIAERSFLDVARIRTNCRGDEDLVFMGASKQDDERSTHDDGLPVLTRRSQWVPTRGIHDQHDLSDTLDPSHIFLRWGRQKDLDGTWHEIPWPKGMSGGGVWALNLKHDPWRADRMQLVGIEYALGSAPAGRYLKAFQMQVWLQMLREDLPELAQHVDPILAAGRLLIG